MKINHEETKGTKKDRKSSLRVRFFVVDFPRACMSRCDSLKQ